MPTLTRWCLRAAMLNLVAALALGVVLALPGSDWPARAPALRPVFYHLLMVGWATQMIYGVGWWMFPRRTPAEPQTPPLAWVAFVSLNAGLLLRAYAEPAVQLSPSSPCCTSFRPPPSAARTWRSRPPAGFRSWHRGV